MRVHVPPNHWSQRCVVARGQSALPVPARQHLLNHQRVDVDHAVLNQVQPEHTNLVVFPMVADHLTTAGERHGVRRVIPSFGYVQLFVDPAAQRFRMPIAAEKDRLDGLAQLGCRPGAARSAV